MTFSFRKKGLYMMVLLQYLIYICIYKKYRILLSQCHRGGVPAFWARTYVTLVTLDLRTAISSLFLLNNLLFLVMRRIHVNPSTQVTPSAHICLRYEINAFIGFRTYVTVIELDKRLNPSIICRQTDSSPSPQKAGAFSMYCQSG